MKTSASISPSMRFLAIILFFLTYSLPCFALTETYGGCYDTSPYRLGWSDFFWSYTIEDGGAIITNVATKNDTYFHSHTPEHIPAQLGGLPVTKISDLVFWCCYFAEAINIPNTVREIGRHAFGSCGSGAGHGIRVKELVIPNSVEIIGEGAFDGAGGQAITIGENVRIIGPNAFEGCRAVNEIHMGSSLTNCAANAFYRVHTDSYPLVHSNELSVYIKDIATWCKIDFTNTEPWRYEQNYNSIFYSGIANGVKLIANGKEVIDLVVPEGVSKIGSLSFAGYTNLLSVTFPASLTTIGDYAFNFCTNITRISISDIASWCNLSVRTRLFDSIYDLYANAKKVTALSIPANITSIRDDLLRKCSSLEQLIVPASVTNIGYSSFAFCSSLKEVRFLGGPPNAQSTSFTNVASGAQGYYPAKHAAKWKTVIKNGMWCGLIMAEAKTPECILRVKSADPAEGSLTLAWEETVPVEGVTYSVYRSATDTYSATDLVTNGLTGTSWTDTTYWSAEPVLKPLNYWVVADGGGYGERASNRVETRHRYGVFVGVGIYEASWFKQLTGKDWFESSSDPPAMRHAELFGRLARENGGFPSDAISVLTGEQATKDAFHNALQDVAQKVQTGDYVAIFCSTHGHRGWYKHFSGLAMHDTFYSKEELASDLEALAAGKNGLNVVVILNSCYSGGAYSASPSGQKFAWIMTSKESEETGTFSKAMGTPLSHYLLEYGWNRGRAGQGPGTMATFADLLYYAMLQMNEFRQLGLLDEEQRFAEPEVLKHFIAGSLGAAKYESTPGRPTVTVTAGENKQTVNWTSDPQAEYFAWVRENESNGKRLIGMCTGDVHTWPDTGEQMGISYLPVQSCLYRLAAINEHGISAWSEPARGTFSSKFWNWLVDKYVGSIIDESTSEEVVAAVATSASANGASYEACYVADIDPNDPHTAFKAKLVREDGKWRAYPMDGEKEGRVYRVEGKKEMSDDAWTDVTTVEDLEAEGWHFFRVGVELAE